MDCNEQQAAPRRQMRKNSFGRLWNSLRSNVPIEIGQYYDIPTFRDSDAESDNCEVTGRASASSLTSESNPRGGRFDAFSYYCNPENRKRSLRLLDLDDEGPASKQKFIDPSQVDLNQGRNRPQARRRSSRLSTEGHPSLILSDAFGDSDEDFGFENDLESLSLIDNCHPHMSEVELFGLEKLVQDGDVSGGGAPNKIEAVEKKDSFLYYSNAENRQRLYLSNDDDETPTTALHQPQNHPSRQMMHRRSSRLSTEGHHSLIIMESIEDLCNDLGLDSEGGM